MSDSSSDISSIFTPSSNPSDLGTLGKYRIIKNLGKGGMGEVYLAHDTIMKRDVALKVMQKQFITSEKAKERFSREARTLANIEHEHVVTVFDSGEHRGFMYIAMQLLKGKTLGQYIEDARGTPINIKETIRIASETAAGLEAIHAKSIIHRDIKPGNLWIEETKKRVKLIDFGLAKGLDADSELTHGGELLGTPGYMSPEQRLGEPADQRSDLYSLGTVLYRLVVGEKVNASTSLLTAEEMCQRHSGLPLEFAKLILQLLAKSPDLRPASATEVIQRIANIENRVHTRVEAKITDHEPTVIEQISPPPKTGPRPRVLPPKKRSLSTGIFAVVIVLLIAVIAMLLIMGDRLLPITTSSNDDPKKKEEPIRFEPPSGGTERLWKVNDRISITLCWIPKGENVTLGSLPEEQQLLLKAEPQALPMEVMTSESASIRGTFSTEGFWLGKYEVTQKEWNELMGQNLELKPEWRGDNLPIVKVSWPDTQDFIKKLNEGTKPADWKHQWKFRLPTEDEWEYACRGGKGNGQAYYFGKGLDGTMANCNAFEPFGMMRLMNPPHRGKATDVGSYENVAKHPWSLCDMHGNVWEWCDATSGQQKSTRGGSWEAGAVHARSAHRMWDAPDRKMHDLGFRIALSLIKE